MYWKRIALPWNKFPHWTEKFEMNALRIRSHRQTDTDQRALVIAWGNWECSLKSLKVQDLYLAYIHRLGLCLSTVYLSSVYLYGYLSKEFPSKAVIAWGLNWLGSHPAQENEEVDDTVSWLQEVANRWLTTYKRKYLYLYFYVVTPVLQLPHSQYWALLFLRYCCLNTPSVSTFWI